MQNSDMPPRPEEIVKWEAEFNQFMNAQREDNEWDHSAAMQRAWEEGAAELGDSFVDNMKFDHEGLPILDPYVFGLFLSILLFLFPLLTERRGKQQIPRSVIFHPVTASPRQTDAREK